MGFSRYAIVVATCRVVSYVLAFVCASFSTSTADAGLVLQPKGDDYVFSGGADDETFRLLDNGSYVTPKTMGSFSGNFYNNPVTNLWISTNGNLNFDQDSSFSPRPFSNTVSPVSSRIAPFWDDFRFLAEPVNQIVNHSKPGSYLAITWKDAFLYNDLPEGTVPVDGLRRTTQVIWFEKKMTLNGFVFEKDDIAFGYSGFQVGIIAATIGVSESTTEFDGIPGDGIPGSTDPGDNDGFISSALGQSSLIPWADNEFLLFRPTADGSSYDGSRQFLTAVPEPSSLFLAISSIALAFAKWRREIFGRFAKCLTK